MDQQGFLHLLAKAVQHGVSDIHLQTGAPPAFRMHGDLVNVKLPPLTDGDLQLICRAMVSEKSFHDRVSEIKDYDGSFEVKNLARFRYNIFRNRGRLAAVLRIISSAVPTFEKLGISPALKKIAEMSRGLVLVTGATGSGKSSTLAAMIDHLNTHFPHHIVTIEDPIEFVHPQKKSRVSQREVGKDTGDFAAALRSALRQDPDVILVGEMRDPVTIDIALKAAETGHLVLSTVHTTDAIKTIGRLIAVFPPEEQRAVRLRLADNLVATISQRLVARMDNKGLVAAQEIMISNKGIQDCIANPDLTGEINDYIMKSKELTGGQTFEQHLADLYRRKIISLDAAKEASSNPSDFERNLLYGHSSSGENDQSKSTHAKAGFDSGSVQLDVAQMVDAASEDDAA